MRSIHWDYYENRDELTTTDNICSLETADDQRGKLGSTARLAFAHFGCDAGVESGIGPGCWVMVLAVLKLVD